LSAPVGGAGALWPRQRLLTGTVARFDERSGLGEIATERGALAFHCTAIADGSRRISEGAAVTFVVTRGPEGRMEAAGITPTASAQSEP
jgi:cold shock CspA family protein